MLINRTLERIDTLILDAHSAVGRKVLSSGGSSQKGFLGEDLRGQLDTHVQDPCSMQKELQAWKPEEARFIQEHGKNFHVAKSLEWKQNKHMGLQE